MKIHIRCLSFREEDRLGRQSERHGNRGEKGREQTSSVWIVLEAEILYSFCNPVDYHNSIRAARNLKNSTWQIGVHIYWIKLIKSVLRTTLTWREDSFCSRRFFVRIFFYSKNCLPKIYMSLPNLIRHMLTLHSCLYPTHGGQIPWAALILVMGRKATE